MKILSIIGARPQFIKASVVSRALASHDGVRECVVHTGQHFDSNMSEIFFQQLGIPHPNHMLDIHSGSHGDMTGRMLIAIEQVILSERPDRVLVYGDTNSTLAGALAAAKLHIPVAHVESGLRSFNLRMPEEINRVLTDQVSDLLFCPTDMAVRNLQDEGFDRKPCRILQLGDVMQDAALLFATQAVPVVGITPGESFILATLHRAENTDDSRRLAAIVRALNSLHERVAPVVLPLHPRTRKALAMTGISLNVTVLEPLGYLQMIWLLQHCGLVITDSGGLQKEAFFFGKTCVTLRDQTEWVELTHCGANRLVGADEVAIVAVARQSLGQVVHDPDHLYGGGRAAERVAAVLCDG